LTESTFDRKSFMNFLHNKTQTGGVEDTITTKFLRRLLQPNFKRISKETITTKFHRRVKVRLFGLIRFLNSFFCKSSTLKR
jgi:hypothetical protein